ncbi:hypothetical protein CTEN210_17971 [Chaetoceros tenuissimus]|uniref:Fringe-like glycosyltransferase domain-containing protein n=1 Tax=Chaetoceros tenuissimus TaxID=426638 RepID=A0AAD3DEG2_9STRA|nr:hypothetical protein CTEN210_17971 [Chaetoceros tenuissimus]
MLELEKISTRCSNRYKFWQNHNAYNKLTHHFSKGFTSIPWLKQKKNPIGWLCAINRADYAFIKYMELLQKSNAAIPDYLMIIDDDTFINMNQLYSYFISNSDEDGYVPKSSTPVIFAGCRVRAAVHQIRFTFPHGGLGIYLSRGALKKWMMPIHCNDTKNLDHVELCRRYTTNPTNSETDNANVTIGEGKFFRNGMNLNQVFKLLFHQGNINCFHGDWFFGYIANYLNISRHVVPKGEFPTVGDGGMSAMFFDGTDRESAVEGVDHDYEKNRTVAENRLHAIMGSEIYKPQHPEGLCLHSDWMEKVDKEFVVYNETIYHKVNPNLMKRIYRG